MTEFPQGFKGLDFGGGSDSVFGCGEKVFPTNLLVGSVASGVTPL